MASLKEHPMFREEEDELGALLGPEKESRSVWGDHAAIIGGAMAAGMITVKLVILLG